MFISLKTLPFFGAIFLTGLSAGLFFAWSVSVIPGTQKVSDSNYLFTMQAINRAILNPVFFLVFFGSLVLMAVSTLQHHRDGMVFGLMLAATLTYFVGTLGVTGMGNVPLNRALDALLLEELTPERLKEFRDYYEPRWNRLHQIRAFSAMLSFLLSLVALGFAGKI